MNIIIGLIISAVVYAAPAAPPPLSRTAGRIVQSSEGRLTLRDDAGHLEEFIVDAKTSVRCEGKKASWPKALSGGRCSRAARVMYDGGTKRASLIDLKNAPATAVDDESSPPPISGEVALTDVLGGKIIVHLGGGANITFAVGDKTKILHEVEDKPPVRVPFESLKVGDRVEIRTADWRVADEIHVSPAR